MAKSNLERLLELTRVIYSGKYGEIKLLNAMVGENRYDATAVTFEDAAGNIVKQIESAEVG